MEFHAEGDGQVVTHKGVHTGSGNKAYHRKQILAKAVQELSLEVCQVVKVESGCKLKNIDLGYLAHFFVLSQNQEDVLHLEANGVDKHKNGSNDYTSFV